MNTASRRLAIKQMLLFTAGGSFLLEGCSPSASVSNNSNLSLPVSKEVYVPAGTISKPADGIVSGFPKIRFEHTNGQFCCQEIHIDPKHAGPPPHLHKQLDEIMYVLEGTIHVMVGDKVTELHAGDCHLRPHGIVHTFWNAGDAPARALDMYPNQDFVSYFEEIVRIGNKLKSQGLAMQSPEAGKLLDDLNKRFEIEIFFDQFPPLLDKYGLKVAMG